MKIAATSSADATYDTESSQKASGSAPPRTRNATNSDASGYPTTSANVSLSHVAEFAVTSSSSRTTLGITAVRAGRKKIETVVSRKTNG